MQYKCRWGYKTPQRTKLDSLYSDEDKENNKPVSENIINENDCVSLSCEGLKPPLDSFSQIDHAVIVMSNNY